jgi:beta-adrenergic-receptor kinase
VCLKYAFTTESDLFLILDLMTGGDLGFHLGNRGRFTPTEAKYFAARTLLGIAHLHEHNIVYRDLKPENILMDENGFTKISDLGLACQIVPNLTGTCGTRGYWAPDMLRRDPKGKRIPYNQTVDWFSFGCVVYEFLCGVSPFRTEQAKTWGGYEKKDKDKAIDRATLEMDPVFDDYFDDDARDICFRLLDKDPQTRLGANGAREIMEHPWFRDINWDDMISERVEPPFKPKKDINAASQQEIGAFSDDKASRTTVLTAEDQAVYAEWDWISPSAFQEEIVEFMRAEEALVSTLGEDPCAFPLTGFC